MRNGTLLIINTSTSPDTSYTIFISVSDFLKYLDVFCKIWLTFAAAKTDSFSKIKFAFMKTKKILPWLGLVMVLMAAQVQAQEEEVLSEPRFPHLFKNVSLGVKASTLGGGAEVAATLTNNINLRVGLNYLSYDVDQDFDDIELNLNGSLALNSYNLLLDYHPGGRQSAFHITGGFLLSSNQVEVTGTPLETYELGGYTFTPDDIGSLTLKLYTRKLNPYLGLGFGTSVPNRRVSLKFELGTVFHGQPKVDMNATGMIAPTAQQADLIAGNMAEYKYWPVMSLQLNFRIF